MPGLLSIANSLLQRKIRDGEPTGPAQGQATFVAAIARKASLVATGACLPRSGWRVHPKKRIGRSWWKRLARLRGRNAKASQALALILLLPAAAMASFIVMTSGVQSPGTATYGVWLGLAGLAGLVVGKERPPRALPSPHPLLPE
jgi:hypothetical protein